MAIESVTSSISAYTSTNMQAGQVRQGNERGETSEPTPAQRVENVEEPPRPVTNAQGQRTGTLINVTA